MCSGDSRLLFGSSENSCKLHKAATRFLSHLAVSSTPATKTEVISCFHVREHSIVLVFKSLFPLTH